MTELGNLFENQDKEKRLYSEIKIAFSKYNKLDAKLTFNYYLYSSIYLFTRGEDISEGILKSLISFIIKEDNMQISIASINNTYHIANMQEPNLIIKILSGQESNIIVLNSDAAKLGALLALNYQIYGIQKTEMLQKALLLSKNML